MIKEFKIEGVENAIKCFDNFERELLNPKEPLNNSAMFMREEAIRNFPEEGQVFEEKWDPLEPSTLKRKEKEGYGNQPMMVRTGRLRDSFIPNIDTISNGSGVASVYNPTPYAISHQQGIGRNLPRRVLLKLVGKQRDRITNIFFDWIVQGVTKSFSN